MTCFGGTQDNNRYLIVKIKKSKSPEIMLMTQEHACP